MAEKKTKAPVQPVQIKQRVIGAIVLVSLGVIFIPMLLNSERSFDDGMPVFGSNIPNKPEPISQKAKVSSAPTSSAIIIKSQADFDARIIIDEQSPNSSASAKKSSAAKLAKVEPKNQLTKNQSTKKPTNAKLDNKIITAKKIPAAKKSPRAWAIQVGSFSERKNAFSLRNKLRSKKFTAFVESVKTAKGQVYRVRVGPEIRREQAEKIQKKLVSELKLKGLVIAHP